jgi:hypothetical protein
MSTRNSFSHQNNPTRSLQRRCPCHHHHDYRAGESFSEMPGDRHSISENASKTEPAKLLALFVVDTDEKELTTPYEE